MNKNNKDEIETFVLGIIGGIGITVMSIFIFQLSNFFLNEKIDDRVKQQITICIEKGCR